jgi:hypothetical protein
MKEIFMQPKTAYEVPVLEVLGTLAALTKGTGGTSQESSSASRKKPNVSGVN